MSGVLTGMERIIIAFLPQNNPQGPNTGQYRVLRGGAWNYSSEYLRVANRALNPPNFRSNSLGFRCVSGF